MSAEAPLGVAVIGMGRAGAARVRDLAATAHRVVHAVGVRAGDAAVHAAIADPDVDAVLVCAANDAHAALVSAALGADRHVLCEFPLALDADTTRALLREADARGLVLHVELIGLLTEAHAAAKAAVVAASAHSEPPSPMTVTLDFSAGLYRWTADEAAAGRLGQLAVGRLHQLWDLAGPLRLENARAEVDSAGYRLTVELRGSRAGDGAEVALELVETRRDGGGRASTLVVVDASGRRVEAPAGAPRSAAAAPAKGLFARDLEVFAARVGASRAGADHHGLAYVDDATIVAVAALADAITAAVAVPCASPAGDDGPSTQR